VSLPTRRETLLRAILLIERQERRSVQSHEVAMRFYRNAPDEVREALTKRRADDCTRRWAHMSNLKTLLEEMEDEE